jgi:Rieske Fe-S protein
MPADQDPVIPTEEEEGVDRRKFVKGAMGAATLGVAGAAGFGMFKQLAIPPDTIVQFIDYFGARVLPGSPAPRGLPFIPVRVTDNGEVEGVPEANGINFLNVLRYCGYQAAPNLQPGFTDDNVFRYFLTEEKIHQAGDRAGDIWFFLDRIGDRVRAEHFAGRDYNTAAAVRWRSENVRPSDIVTMMILKLDPGQFDGPHVDMVETFMQNDEHLIGMSAICTHFCCVPGYKETDLARQFNAWEMAFCTCHNSRWNPYEISSYNFMLRETREE